MNEKESLLEWFAAEQSRGNYFSRRELAKLTVGQKAAMGCPPLSRAKIVRLSSELRAEGKLRVVDSVYCKYVVVGKEVVLDDRGFGIEPPQMPEPDNVQET